MEHYEEQPTVVLIYAPWPRRLASAATTLLVLAAISALFLGPTLNRVFADTTDPAKATFRDLRRR